MTGLYRAVEEAIRAWRATSVVDDEGDGLGLGDMMDDSDIQSLIEDIVSAVESELSATQTLPPPLLPPDPDLRVRVWHL